jgi:hypothetical protein
VPAVGEKALEPRFGLEPGIRRGDADDIEAECVGALRQFISDGNRVAQKSRSA